MTGMMAGGAGKARASHRGNFEATDGAENRDSVREAGVRWKSRAAVTDFGLAKEACVVRESSAASNDFRKARTPEW